MTRCARCGLEADAADLTVSGECPGPAEARLQCRDRELANLRSLLRSVTGKLERIGEQVNDVLEVIS
jgi:hypothetical protein